MKNIILLLLSSALFVQCSTSTKNQGNPNAFIMESSKQQAIDSLIKKYGEAQQEQIERGVNGVASLWQAADGDQQAFVDFCTGQFAGNSAKRYELFKRISENMEVIRGSFNAITVGLQRPIHVESGQMLAVDEIFGSYSPAAHFTDDFFSNKLAFNILLNFPYYSLAEKTALAGEWGRKDWAYARLGDLFDSRVPSDVMQQVINANTRSELYIAAYNIFAGKLVNDKGQQLFPVDMKLLSHWNIRDEIKSNYGAADGFEKQQMLYEVMKRVVSQEIPQQVINNNEFTWNPYQNKLYDQGAEKEALPEPSTRYEVLLNFFHAHQKVDLYYPVLNTFIKRSFETGMEIPLADVEALFNAYLSSPEVKQVAGLIKKRLGRDLEPFDIWYDGFKTRTSIPAEKLDGITRSRYPDRDAVQRNLPQMLIKLGFTSERAHEIAARIQVDPARGSGHAWGAESRDQLSLLRTRIFSNGMDYKGYNIAVHEFGHNVEQTITLHDVDYYMLHGVPNTAFTEAMAFMFQKNDLKLLGMQENGNLQDHYNNLDVCWSLYEIMGVSLVDIGVWKWLYENPSATPEALKDAVNRIAKEVWNKYYAPVFGINDQPVLAIYSHMINAPLYLPNYAYGHIIEFQLAGFLAGKNFAPEVERIYRQGRLTPQEWMKGAVGNVISADPVLKAVQEALENI
ncbi:MAG: hypothetical protein JXQ80_12585 [Bacteroidales bacterium]|nr:hypothetical protein [Bacteroidales bacterium]